MPKVGYIEKVQSVGWDSLKAGVAGGLACGVLGGFAGSLGAIIGAILAGAAVGGNDGRVVAINGVQDAITAAIAGAMRSG